MVRKSVGEPSGGPTANEPMMAVRQELWSAKRKALETRQIRERAELDAQQLLERAKEARRAEDRARKELDRLTARLKAAEQTVRSAEAQHASASAAAGRVTRVAADAAEKKARAHQAEEAALAEVSRIEHRLRQADVVVKAAPSEEAPSEETTSVVGGDAPPVIIDDEADEPGDEPEPTPARPTEARVAGFEMSGRPSRLLLASLAMGGLAIVVVVTAWALGGSSGVDPRAADPQGAQQNIETGTGAVVPDAEGLSAFDARRRLMAAGLSLAEVVPTPGIPGEVVRSVPAAGRHVPPGTPVTLYIGVEANRYEREVTSAFTPG